MTGQPTDPPKAAIMDALQRALAPGNRILSLEAYIECVLYDPEAGYYRRPRQRVGRSSESDFYTASSLGDLFAQLVLAGVQSVLGNKWAEHTWVEAGPETESGLLGQMKECPFRDCRLIRPGDPIEIPPQAVFFSNELFDAQPFRRFVRSGGEWREAGVRVLRDRLEPVLIDADGDLPPLPEEAQEGYTIDWPTKAHSLLETIAGQEWKGLFLAFDYGLDRSIILKERPAGTGRTYASHRMGTDLLAEPGRTDITCHVIWDEMEAILSRHEFQQIQVLRQESFFMNHSGQAIEAVLSDSPSGFSNRKQTLMELLHPGNMGHKFQVLSAIRD